MILATDGFLFNSAEATGFVIASVCREDELVKFGRMVDTVAWGYAQQAVPRAEAVALCRRQNRGTTWQLLSMLKHVVKRLRTHVPVVLLACKNAVRRSQHEHVLLTKVKSHLTREVFAELFGTGNQKADAHALLGLLLWCKMGLDRLLLSW